MPGGLKPPASILVPDRGQDGVVLNRSRAEDVDPLDHAPIGVLLPSDPQIGFRQRTLIVFQVRLTRRIDALPITRDYMADAERRAEMGRE